MLNGFLELCSSRNGLAWLIVGSDIAIATAYLMIPLTLGVVLAARKKDIAYPWLWLLFVAFIVACGLTHAVHVWSAVSGFEKLPEQATAGLLCAGASVATAIAFAFVLPDIVRLPSPGERQAELKRLVAVRTREKDKLIQEIHHRVGNQLQVLSSQVSLEARAAASEDVLSALNRIRQTLDKMAEDHKRRSQHDYLESEINAGVSISGLATS